MPSWPAFRHPLLGHLRGLIRLLKLGQDLEQDWRKNYLPDPSAFKAPNTRAELQLEGNPARAWLVLVRNSVRAC